MFYICLFIFSTLLLYITTKTIDRLKSYFKFKNNKDSIFNNDYGCIIDLETGQSYTQTKPIIKAY